LTRTETIPLSHSEPFLVFQLFFCGCFRPAFNSGIVHTPSESNPLFWKYQAMKMNLKIFVATFVLIVIFSKEISFQVEARPHHINGVEEQLGTYEGYEAYDPTGYLKEKQTSQNWMSPPDPNYTKIYV
ncbi:hypothetical protein WDU94_009924, partial [Cyamophila willieti]